MLGPSHAYSYFWDAGLDGCIVPVPWTTTDALRPAMRAAGARYIVLDYSLLRDRAGLREWADVADDSDAPGTCRRPGASRSATRPTRRRSSS